MKIPRPGAAMLAALTALLPAVAVAADGAIGTFPDMTTGALGILAVVTFVVAYGLVISEEFSHLRKSKPVIVAAGFIWVLVAIAYQQHGDIHAAERALRAVFLEYAELMLFLLSAMTFINTMDERHIFRAIRGWMVSAGFSLRTIYWLTGLLAFFISPFADNLTTALLMVSVVLAVSKDSRFIAVSCISIVVGANAGGAFSPFGDITTLMVWQKGMVKFHEFFALFIPSVVNWLVPAALMAMAVPKEKPHAVREKIRVKYGGYVVVGLFLCTIAMTVGMHQFLHLPPFLGMMTGLGLLKVYGYFIRRDELRNSSAISGPTDEAFAIKEGYKPAHKPFDIFISMKRAEWDTLMFFYGVVLCVGGLGAFGYLAATSQFLYQGFGATAANIFIGLASAVIDNIPIMYAVLSMNPDMSHGQWLLVTLTAGVGGSLLSIGSAAGVALMGQARGIYTFFSHLKWTWAIALGYAASIWVHFLINARSF
ncbi:MAG: sodium:proton antiporter NhaD [Pseudomonadota bacterium]